MPNFGVVSVSVESDRDVTGDDTVLGVGGGADGFALTVVSIAGDAGDMREERREEVFVGILIS